MDKWFVIYENEKQFNIIDKHFNKCWSYVKSDGVCGYCSENVWNSGNNWMYNQEQQDNMIKNGYKKLSWEEFETLILGKESLQPYYEVY